MDRTDRSDLERTSPDRRPLHKDFFTQGAGERDTRFERPFRTTNRRPQRPTRSVRRVPCMAASIKAHRDHGEPRRVMRLTSAPSDSPHVE